MKGIGTSLISIRPSTSSTSPIVLPSCRRPFMRSPARSSPAVEVWVAAIRPTYQRCPQQAC